MKEDSQPEQINTNTNNDPQKSGNKVPVVPVNIGKVDAPKHPDTSNTDTRQRKRKPLSRFQCWTIGLAGVGILVAAGTGLAIVCQDIIAHRTLIEMQLEKRPWVSIDNTGEKGIVPFDDLTIQGSTANFPLRVSLKNFGQSPAKVEIRADIVNVGYDTGATLLTAVENTCKSQGQPESTYKGWPATIVPGTITYNHTWSPEITKITQGNEIKPTIVGCIWYQATTGDTSLHKTPFSGQISMATDSKRAAVEPTNPIQIPPKRAIAKGDWAVVDILMKGTAD